MSILVAGALHLDVVVRTPHLPTIDETVPGSDVSYLLGGKGGNQALAACAMGAETHFASRTGHDDFGKMLRQGLAGSGLHLSQLQSDPGPSGMSVAMVDGAGAYGAVIVSAANLNFDAAAVTLPVGLRLLLLQNEIPDDANAALAARAKAAGAQVWLNAAPARELSPQLLVNVDLLIVNRVEAAFYADLDGGPPVLETLGADGVRHRDAHFPGFDVEVVSTHGAGDMFCGALAAEVCAGSGLPAAIALAQAAAALHVSAGPGGRDHLDRAAVARFLTTHPSR